MKKIALVFSICIIGNIISAQIELNGRNDSLYIDYTYESFLKLDILKKKIDYKNIDYDLLNATIFYLTNKERDQHGKFRFKYSKALNQSAQAHSEDMVNYHFYSHISRVKGKKTLPERLKLVGLVNVSCSENIASCTVSFPTYLSLSESFVFGWMNSPPHRANILSESFNYLGCGTYNYNPENRRQYNLFGTQNFSSEDVE